MPTEYRVVRVSVAAHENLRRLSIITDQTMGRLVEGLLTAWVARLREHMSDDEFRRFETDDLSPRAAQEIRLREAKFLNKLEPAQLIQFKGKHVIARGESQQSPEV